MLAKGLEVQLFCCYNAEKDGIDAVTVKSAESDVYSKCKASNEACV